MWNDLHGREGMIGNEVASTEDGGSQMKDTYVIRFERESCVHFVTQKGDTQTLTEARVFTYRAVAFRHAIQQRGTSQHVVAVRTDNNGRAAWCHPSWLKTAEEVDSATK